VKVESVVLVLECKGALGRFGASALVVFVPAHAFRASSSIARHSNGNKCDDFTTGFIGMALLSWHLPYAARKDGTRAL
jgi:hypothetical protein